MSAKAIRSNIWDPVECLARPEIEKLLVNRLRASVERVSNTVTEVIEPDTGEPVSDGELGELALTCVTQEAHPLIRNRTRLIPEKCPCGRSTVRMEALVEQTDDRIVVRGVNVFPSQIETILLQVGEVDPHYQIIVNRKSSCMDELDILVEAPAETYGNQGRLVQLEKGLSYEVESALGISCNVKLVGPQEIDRSDGKAVRVDDKSTL